MPNSAPAVFVEGESGENGKKSGQEPTGGDQISSLKSL